MRLSEQMTSVSALGAGRNTMANLKELRRVAAYEQLKEK